MFYDKHFKDTFVLQRVELFSALPTYLAENVDKYLKAATKLPTLRGFITADVRKDLGDRNAEDETDVVDYYDKTTATYCVRVASTLALHPTSSWKNSLLKWTKTGPHSNYAIADGHLCFREYTNDRQDREAIVESMEEETRLIYEKMRKDNESLATWEFKSLTSGPVNLMNAVCGLGNFSWTYCDTPGCLKDIKEEKVNKAKFAPDALNSPWKLPVSLRPLNRKKYCSSYSRNRTQLYFHLIVMHSLQPSLNLLTCQVLQHICPIP